MASVKQCQNCWVIRWLNKVLTVNYTANLLLNPPLLTSLPTNSTFGTRVEGRKRVDSTQQHGEHQNGVPLCVLESKAEGAWILHNNTASVETVEHFVVMSSTSAALGNPGQANYAAANSFLDGLVQMRRNLGLPGLAFNMGAVSDAGMAARDMRVLKAMKVQGVPAMSSAFAIEILDHAIRNKLDHIVGMRVHHWGALPDGPGCVRVEPQT
eukprot:6299248-Pyramimonas_sp.AAC.2